MHHLKQHFSVHSTVEPLNNGHMLGPGIEVDMYEENDVWDLKSVSKIQRF